MPQALQAFLSTQIKALNAAKLTICNMLSEVMVKMAVPLGMEAGFSQLVMTILIQPPEDRDVRVVQFMEEQEGGEEPQAIAVQQSCEKTPYLAEEPHKLRSQDSCQSHLARGFGQSKEKCSQAQISSKETRTTIYINCVLSHTRTLSWKEGLGQKI